KNNEDVSAVVENEADGAGLQAWGVADGIMVRTDEKAAVSVYDANGRLVAVADVDGEALVKVPARGVYVVASGGGSVKVIK
ncbi:MAG: T9SS type A sorting domain-containing protein, partial [Paludibacteraceae bacterium]|nr:T9SS type A sorting domain-containing protein [Paludibacteraceae bacterium]